MEREDVGDNGGFWHYFWEYVDDTPGCWLWSGAYSKAGYGIVARAGHHGFAHRIAYEMEYGVKVPKGKLVCHKCNNPCCVRPDHLYVGTHKDNSRDAVECGHTSGGQIRRRIREVIARGKKLRELAAKAA